MYMMEIVIIRRKGRPAHCGPDVLQSAGNMYFAEAAAEHTPPYPPINAIFRHR